MSISVSLLSLDIPSLFLSHISLMMVVFSGMGRGSVMGLVVAWFDGSLTAICVAWRFVDGLFAEDHDWWLIFPTPNS